jgi:hypothetical protein
MMRAHSNRNLLKKGGEDDNDNVINSTRARLLLCGFDVMLIVCQYPTRLTADCESGRPEKMKMLTNCNLDRQNLVMVYAPLEEYSLQ